MGFKPQDHDYYQQGTEAHEIVQKHVSKVKIHPALMKLTDKVDGKEVPLYIPIVEKVKFDPSCQIVFPVLKSGEGLSLEIKKQIGVVTSKELLNLTSSKYPLTEEQQERKGFLESVSEYWMVCYLDGQDPAKNRFLEIKSSSKLWSLGQFEKLMQRKIYSFAKPEYTNTVCVTVSRDPQEWRNGGVKKYTVPASQEDKEQAYQFLLDGIKVLESGDYNGGLDENGKCTDYRCYYGVNCNFK